MLCVKVFLNFSIKPKSHELINLMYFLSKFRWLIILGCLGYYWSDPSPQLDTSLLTLNEPPLAPGSSEIIMLIWLSVQYLWSNTSQRTTWLNFKGESDLRNILINKTVGWASLEKSSNWSLALTERFILTVQLFLQS